MKIFGYKLISNKKYEELLKKEARWDLYLKTHRMMMTYDFLLPYFDFLNNTRPVSIFPAVLKSVREKYLKSVGMEKDALLNVLNENKLRADGLKHLDVIAQKYIDDAIEKNRTAEE